MHKFAWCLATWWRVALMHCIIAHTGIFHVIAPTDAVLDLILTYESCVYIRRRVVFNAGLGGSIGSRPNPALSRQAVEAGGPRFADEVRRRTTHAIVNSMKPSAQPHSPTKPFATTAPAGMTGTILPISIVNPPLGAAVDHA
jgi:hypothetical protein